MVSKKIPASQLLQELVEQKKDTQTISLGDINAHLSERGFAILMILFAFPMAIPLPYPPGFTTVFGLPLLIFSVQMILGMEKPLLPNWIAQKTIKTSHLVFAVEKGAKYFLRAENFLKPRLTYFSSIAGEKIIGIISLLCAITITLPIWGGNAIPSAGILIMAFGLLGKDGAVIIAGIITSIIGLIVAYFIVFLFFYGAKMAAGSFLQDAYIHIMSHIGMGASLMDE